MDREELEKKKLAVADSLPEGTREKWLKLRSEIDSLTEEMFNGERSTEELANYKSKILELENESGFLAGLPPIDLPNKNAASEIKTAKEMNKYNNRFRYKLFAYLALFIGIVIVLVVKNT